MKAARLPEIHLANIGGSATAARLAAHLSAKAGLGEPSLRSKSPLGYSILIDESA